MPCPKRHSIHLQTVACNFRISGIIGGAKKGKKMPTIRQYRPAFFEGFENETVEFSTTRELLDVPFVKNFCHDGFSGFAVSDEHLMATYKNGKEWWVVGTLSDPHLVKLPKWQSGIAPQNIMEDSETAGNT
jgi:hypothetical protein